MIMPSLLTSKILSLRSDSPRRITRQSQSAKTSPPKPPAVAYEPNDSEFRQEDSPSQQASETPSSNKQKTWAHGLIGANWRFDELSIPFEKKFSKHGNDGGAG